MELKAVIPNTNLEEIFFRINCRYFYIPIELNFIFSDSYSLTLKRKSIIVVFFCYITIIEV